MNAPSPVPPSLRPTVMGTRHVIAAGNYLSTHAGFMILEAGGNAVDAGVAAGLVSNVVEPHMTGFHGLTAIMVYSKESDAVSTIAGVGWWGEKSTPEWYEKNTGGKITLGGIYEAVVPGAPDGWLTALERFGTLSFADVAETAIRLAREGFPVHPHMAMRIAESVDNTRQWPGCEAIFLPGGKVPAIGDLFVQADLAATLQYLADEETAAAAKGGREAGFKAARDAFYRGDVAETMARFHADNGGLITLDDFAAYACTVEPPLKIEWGGLDVYGMGPWGSGAMGLEILNMLDARELEAMGHNSADYVHTVVEAIKLAAADREAYFGDPRFVDVPVERIISKEYAAERRKQIRKDEAWPDIPPPGDLGGGIDAPWTGAPRQCNADSEADPQRSTSFVGVMDRFGNAFSSTFTDGALGTPVVPGTGLSVSMSGRGFWTDRRYPARVGPRKRPRTVCSPMLAIRKRREIMAWGTPGADVIPQAQTQVFLNNQLWGLEPQEAVEAPRFASYSFPQSYWPHSHEPGVLRVEDTIPSDVGDELARRGHKVIWWPSRHWLVGSVSCVKNELDKGLMKGGSDHRRGAYVLGW